MPIKKNKVVVISKHIHSCFAGASSTDVTLSIVSSSEELDFRPALGKITDSKKFPMLNGEKIIEICGDSQYMGIYLEPNKTFYNRGLNSGKIFDSFEKTPEFKELVQSYVDKGFINERKIPEQRAFWDRENEKCNQERKEIGVVLWMDYEEYSKCPEKYQGGFSDEVFNSKELKEYVEKGCAFGWIGNSTVRTSEHDKQIEAGLKKRGISPHKMHSWISSSSGRHFADSLEGYSKEEQEEKIEEGLNNMYNSCLIFDTPSHDGFLTSSKKIGDWLRELNLLLPYNGEYNRDEHLENVMKVKKTLSEKESLSPDEKHLDQMVNSIFANLI